SYSCFFFSSRRRHTRFSRDWSSDVCSSDLDIKAVTEGVELTLKSLLDALKRHNVESIDPMGEPFDPQLHQAMTAVEKTDVEPNRSEERRVGKERRTRRTPAH